MDTKHIHGLIRCVLALKKELGICRQVSPSCEANRPVGKPADWPISAEEHQLLEPTFAQTQTS